MIARGHAPRPVVGCRARPGPVLAALSVPPMPGRGDQAASFLSAPRLRMPVLPLLLCPVARPSPRPPGPSPRPSPSVNRTGGAEGPAAFTVGLTSPPAGAGWHSADRGELRYSPGPGRLHPGDLVTCQPRSLPPPFRLGGRRGGGRAPGAALGFAGPAARRLARGGPAWLAGAPAVLGCLLLALIRFCSRSGCAAASSGRLFELAITPTGAQDLG